MESKTIMATVFCFSSMPRKLAPVEGVELASAELVSRSAEEVAVAVSTDGLSRIPAMVYDRIERGSYTSGSCQLVDVSYAVGRCVLSDRRDRFEGATVSAQKV
jgi:hypothetical protein